jgi:hypothetical protein
MAIAAAEVCRAKILRELCDTIRSNLASIWGLPELIDMVRCGDLGRRYIGGRITT